MLSRPGGKVGDELEINRSQIVMERILILVNFIGLFAGYAVLASCIKVNAYTDADLTQL
jgi:hypothetical protein